MYTISFNYDQEDMELNLYIYDGDEKEVYRESIVGIEDIHDARFSCLEIAKDRGYWPAMFDDDPRATGSIGGKKRTDSMTPEQRSKLARKAAAARWGSKK